MLLTNALFISFLDDFPDGERASTYLDYVKAREQEYEYALHLRDAMRRNEDRYNGLGYDDEHDERSDEDDDEDDEGYSRLDEGEEDDNEVKRRRNLKRIQKLKDEMNNQDSPNHVLHKFKDSGSESHAKIKDSKVRVQFL